MLSIYKTFIAWRSKSFELQFQEVTCLDFHPTHSILASGSTDYSIRFFEYSKPSVKKAYKSIQEAAPVRCLSFHPSGDFLLVGADHPTGKYNRHSKYTQTQVKITQMQVNITQTLVNTTLTWVNLTQTQVNIT